MKVNCLEKSLGNAVWGKDYLEERNITLSFVLDMQRKTCAKILLSAATCFKVFADGQIIGFGPNRAAHGYARVSEYSLCCRYITVEVHSHNVKSFCWIKQRPFFVCKVESEYGSVFYADDFKCFLLDDRVQRVQRYSFQRGFSEIYRVEKDRKRLYFGDEIFTRIKTKTVPVPVLLNSYTSYPRLDIHLPVHTLQEGTVITDNKKQVWRDRAHTEIEGYKPEEWEGSATDDVSKFTYAPSVVSGKMRYKIVDFSRALTGFIELAIKASAKGTVYVVFDEILAADGTIDFARNETSNVIKWTICEKGEFSVSSFEPYTARYMSVVYTDGIEVTATIRDYENPDVKGFSFECDDERVNKIMRAAVETLAQNSVDILTDCPSRERAGWLSDSWFSSVAEYIVTGDNKVERAFLENYVLADCSKVEKGLLPMCYPSDMYYENIPNWSMWYVLEVVKYAAIHGVDDLVDSSKSRVYDVFDYFNKKENEFGLLEDLDGWVFVEWSEANDPSHVCGVNVPSNMCYAACLERAGRLFHKSEWICKSRRIREFIKENAYDGKFFVDNLIRNDKDELVRTNNYTEVCQYYAFWFDCITKEEYPELFDELISRLGCNRKQGYLPWLGKPNVMYGIYMRIDLLMRKGDRKAVLDECIKYFLPMAEKTGTLWEHNDTRASCVHGFASYVIRWLIFAVKGYDALEKNKKDVLC